RTAAAEDGRYHLAAAQTGSYVLVASGATIRPVAVLVQLHGVPVTADLAAAPSTGIVSGRLVSDRNGEPLGGGTVVLTTAGRVIGRAGSAADGGFRLRNVPV